MLLLATATAFAAAPSGEAVLLFQGRGETGAAPHGEGNVYAPEVHVEDGLYRMWDGGQGADGHDRIHYAESRDGITWERRGVVLDNGSANHINDPSIVRVDGLYYMYYTHAEEGVMDEIHLAVSEDGVDWRREGRVLKVGEEGAWDSLLVGRPAVIHEDGVFKMWYDGRGGRSLEESSGRHVGYATSEDGRTWTRHEGNPVFGQNAGGIEVKHVGERYVMLYESREGVKRAVSPDGLDWTDQGLWAANSGEPFDRHGRVTPFLLLGPGGRPAMLYFGAAAMDCWCGNAVAAQPLR